MNRQREKLLISVREGELRVESCREARSLCLSLKAEGFLSEDLKIDKLEALYQLALGNAIYDGRDGWEAVVKLSRDIGIQLSTFLVYYDLRRRGRLVKTSPYPRSNLVLEKTPSKRVEILVLEAGRKVKLRDIAEWARLVQSSNHIPVIAIVDELGVITYYEVSASTTLF